MLKIGQLVIDYCRTIGETKCRVVFAEPSDLIAYHVALKVAAERNEPLGKTIGYHVTVNNR